jgi:hypothetical protein
MIWLTINNVHILELRLQSKGLFIITIKLAIISLFKKGFMLLISTHQLRVRCKSSWPQHSSCDNNEPLECQVVARNFV